MSFVIEDIPQQGGGWLKPAERKDALAILVEVKAFDAQRSTPNGPKDSVLADLTFFNTEAELESGTPGDIVTGTRIEQTVLARDLAGLVGKATIVTLAQIESKKPGQHPAWVWRQVSGTRKEQVIAYAQKREAELAAAVAAAPSFD